MPELKRTTIYLEAPLHRALRLKSAETDLSISALVNAAVRLSLSAWLDGTQEPRPSFASFVQDLKQRGEL